MRPQNDEERLPSAPQPPTLEYAPKAERRGVTLWASKFLASLGKPMSMGRLYVIMFALSLLATIIAMIITAIIQAIRWAARRSNHPPLERDRSTISPQAAATVYSLACGQACRVCAAAAAQLHYIL